MRAVEEGRIGGLRAAALRLGAGAAGLRARLHGPAGGEIVEQLAEILGRQVLVIVIADLDHGGVAAGAEAFDLDPGEFAVGRHGSLRPDALFADRLELDRAADMARHRTAEL